MSLAEAEQPPQIVHLRLAVTGWGLSKCGASGGELSRQVEQVTCPACLDLIKALITSERDG